MGLNDKTLRDQYALELKALHISPKTRTIFSDELAEYTIFPFRNEHKAIKGFPNIEGWNTIIILVTTNSEKRLKQLVCKYRIIDNQIYMDEKMFNSHWTQIEKSIHRRIKRSGLATLKKASDIVDLSWYEHKQSIAALQDGKIKISIATIEWE